MGESTELFQHLKTRNVYAVRRKWDGELIGSAGPFLNPDEIKNVDSIIVTADLNEWIQENGDELVLIYNEVIGISKERIRDIGNYIKDLEEGLCECDYGSISMQTEYSNVYDTIKTLMDLSYKTDDRKLKPMLANMELRARKCLDRIERKTAMRN